MKTIKYSDIKKLNKELILGLTPCSITADGDIIAYLVMPEDVVVISDMALAAQIRLKALAARMRTGMPKDTEVSRESLQPSLDDALASEEQKEKVSLYDEFTQRD